jgi:hypothetical protein
LITSNTQGQEITKSSSNDEFNSSIEKPYKVISFGEKVNFGKIENSIIWSISCNDSNILTS